jgi:peptidylprolyl isomerase
LKSANVSQTATSSLVPLHGDGLFLHTDHGDIVAVLYPQAAPKTVAHIEDLVRRGYYDGRAFERTVPGHVIQISDPGGLTYTEDPQTIPLEPSPQFHFSAGALGIARGNSNDSGGSEIFIMDYATSHLDGNYTVFGQVLDGLNVVHAIARAPAVQASPPLPLLFFDRQAVPPAQILGATVSPINLSASRASELPLDVAQDVRSGNYRHSLEWPANLRSNVSSNLTWYVRPFNGAPSLDPSKLKLEIVSTGATNATAQWPALSPEANLPDILHFRWMPPRPGAYNATLYNGTAVGATLRILVPDS